MKFFWLLFIPIISFSQKTPVSIAIDSITSIDSVSCRKFTINYSIRNLSNNTISFILNPDQIHSSASGSLNVCIASTLFQENEELPIESILISSYKIMANPTPHFESIKNEEERKKAIKQYLKESLDFDIETEMKKVKYNDTTYNPKTKSSENIMKSIMTMLPNEVKHFSKTLFWDKIRYRKINDLQYYITEKSNCYLELNMVLLKEEYKEKMLDSDYTNLMNLPNFIKGWFTSNRVEINFKE